MRKNHRLAVLLMAVMMLLSSVNFAALAEEEDAPVTHIAQCTVALKVRSKPADNAGGRDSIPRGSFVYIIEYDDEWCKVRTDRVEGYIKTKYIFGATAGVTVSGGTTVKPSVTVTRPASYDAAAIMTRTAFGVVNVRKGAGTNYASAGKLSRGDKLYVTGKTGDWYKVQTTSGVTGYVRSDYVSFGVTAKTTGNVNFRKGAGTGYSIIRELASGASVTLHSVDGKWAKVSYGGKTGYVHTSYLNLY